MPGKAGINGLLRCRNALGLVGTTCSGGNISRGVKMYEACVQQIRSDGDHSLAVLASLHQVLAEVTAGQKITEDRLAVAPSHLKDADPDFAVVLNAISRAQTKQT